MLVEEEIAMSYDPRKMTDEQLVDEFQNLATAQGLDTSKTTLGSNPVRDKLEAETKAEILRRLKKAKS
ncbi:MAG: hypothetical protein A3I39_02580 [Candidatus Yanofskybacteria bacterium RIFCSPLOWO2_02_FULL_47_9b]|uniref:Uncharacterized protein n=1 Tax=Candidatus Yanofskybacteria bacterium RIFCSPLOWO2_02_FULL_47_9b TaxID=1802708 RepID=A0A1F8H6E0_9BACT|nr:MAG: hypothetical protein A3I39_02580 [Candidatus Yanofskybacteria bacterium RIFCSPLOWO2_02_FULL_47_9b]